MPEVKEAKLKRLIRLFKRRNTVKLVSENYKWAGFRNERYDGMLKYNQRNVRRLMDDTKRT